MSHKIREKFEIIYPMPIFRHLKQPQCMEVLITAWVNWNEDDTPGRVELISVESSNGQSSHATSILYVYPDRVHEFIEAARAHAQGIYELRQNIDL